MPIARLHLVTASGERTAPAADTDRLTVRAEWVPAAGRERHAVTAFDLLADPLCPRLGDRLIDWQYDPLTDSYWNAGVVVPSVPPPPPPPFGFPPAPPERPGGSPLETAFGVTRRVPRDPDAVLVGITPRQEGDDPWTWLLELEYAGDKDPTAEAPEVQYDSVPYVVQKVQDVHGMTLTNSALDPYAEGIPVEESRNQLVIVRHVPDGLWNPAYRTEYENTLNLLPYVHNVRVVQRDADGNPVVDDDTGEVVVLPAAAAPSGQARIKTLRAVRMPRVRTPHKARRTWYWKLTAVLEFDGSTFIDNNGATQPVNWRAVLADMGTGQRVDGVRTELWNGGGSTPGTPVPLDGRGRKADWRYGPNDSRAATQDADPTYRASVTVPPAASGYPRPDHTWYATKRGQVLRIPAPGLLANVSGIVPNGPPPTVSVTDFPDAAHGTVDLKPDGSFVFTPASDGDGGYMGWTHFQYIVRQDGRTSNRACCVIFVGPALKVRVFDRFKTKDWTPIAHLIAGW